MYDEVAAKFIFSVFMLFLQKDLILFELFRCIDQNCLIIDITVSETGCSTIEIGSRVEMVLCCFPLCSVLVSILYIYIITVTLNDLGIDKK